MIAGLFGDECPCSSQITGSSNITRWSGSSRVMLSRAYLLVILRGVYGSKNEAPDVSGLLLRTQDPAQFVIAGESHHRNLEGALLTTHEPPLVSTSPKLSVPLGRLGGSAFGVIDE